MAERDTRKAKERDIIVRTGKDHEQPKNLIGKMYRVYSVGERSVHNGGGWHIAHEYYRVATDVEKANYFEGIRNVNDIKIDVDSFSII